MKLWDKENSKTSEAVERFTVGRDAEYDIRLAQYDVQGSLAHTTMLHEVGLLDKISYDAIQQGLQQLLQEIGTGAFSLPEDAEDIHSGIELLLTQRIGDAGKMIHSGRSRNDQVITDLKLYMRDEVVAIRSLVLELFEVLQSQSERYKDVLLPGYTHLQVAMPSSFGLWLGAYAESLVDDMDPLACAYRMINKNPLGSGAGYGSSFPLDRERTTVMLGFAELHYNSIYAQMSRGKSEHFLLTAIAAIASTLSRLAMDGCLFLSQNFAFMQLPDDFTTGSSIMPHKKNPDVFELVRGKCNLIKSKPNELALLMSNLPSGYHRELQLTKQVLFPAIDDLKDCLSIMCMMLREIVVKDNILSDKKYAHIFSVERLNDLVNEGIAFRDAYKIVAKEIAEEQLGAHRLGVHTHIGSIGKLCNDRIKTMMESVAAQIPDSVSR